ncbi:MAG: stage II sporulation protein R, partial [Acutalibacteraceae bacterium]
MKRLEISLLIALVFGIVLSITSLNVECDDIRESVLRLHVLANSDDEADQNLKLKVRDRLLEVSNDIYSNAKTREDAIESTESNLALLQSEAQKVVIANGYNYPVSVELEDTYFTTRTYENITLPAGEYKALRVIIGEGAGHNWWCVMFPPLCISAAS